MTTPSFKYGRRLGGNPFRYGRGTSKLPSPMHCGQRKGNKLGAHKCQGKDKSEQEGLKRRERCEGGADLGLNHKQKDKGIARQDGRALVINQHDVLPKCTSERQEILPPIQSPPRIL